MTEKTELKIALSLTGNRTLCTGCNEYFNHDYGFDRHRAGKHKGNQRRCLSVVEMVKKGFSKNAKTRVRLHFLVIALISWQMKVHSGPDVGALQPYYVAAIPARAWPRKILPS
jgi:hypothetical protein